MDPLSLWLNYRSLLLFATFMSTQYIWTTMTAGIFVKTTNDRQHLMAYKSLDSLESICHIYCDRRGKRDRGWENYIAKVMSDWSSEFRDHYDFILSSAWSVIISDMINFKNEKKRNQKGKRIWSRNQWIGMIKWLSSAYTYIIILAGKHVNFFTHI